MPIPILWKTWRAQTVEDGGYLTRPEQRDRAEWGRSPLLIGSTWGIDLTSPTTALVDGRCGHSRISTIA